MTPELSQRWRVTWSGHSLTQALCGLWSCMCPLLGVPLPAYSGGVTAPVWPCNSVFWPRGPFMSHGQTLRSSSSRQRARSGHRAYNLDLKPRHLHHDLLTGALQRGPTASFSISSHHGIFWVLWAKLQSGPTCSLEQPQSPFWRPDERVTVAFPRGECVVSTTREPFLALCSFLRARRCKVP